MRIVSKHLSTRTRLIDIEEASQVHAVGAQIAHAEDGVLKGLKLDPQAALDPVRLHMILRETHNGGRQQNTQSSGIIRIRVVPCD